MTDPPITVTSLANVLVSSHGVEEALERARSHLDQAVQRHEEKSAELWRAVIAEIRQRMCRR